MPAELRKRKEKAVPTKPEDMPPAKKAAKAAVAPKRKGELTCQHPQWIKANKTPCSC
jgi:hypothetical protein